jgi:2-keto-4-pentenoate hydratase/2-oxohepta-3-ene-1,7-dioic acid hydratase in catechol pathway
MKLAAIDTEKGPAVGVVVRDDVLDLTAAWPSLFGGRNGGAPATVLDLIASDGALSRLRTRLADPGSFPAEHVRSLGGVRLNAPLPTPGKLICVASNYAAHIEESGRSAPVDRHNITPWLFLKPPTTIVAPGAAILVPRDGQAIDWEVELAAVIGKPGKHIPAQRALDHVFGYTIINDISERRFKAPEGRPEREWDKFFDWLHGKWFDGFAPMGPWIVTADEIADPQALTLELRVNGRLRQRGSTAQMIYPVAELVAFASSIMTLMPGDVIATGTPQGVGAATGEFLRAGDVVECMVEGAGTLVNPVRAEDDP